MVIQLYSEKKPETDAQAGLIQNLIYRGLVEGQFTPKNVKLNAYKVDQLDDRFRNAVKKAKNAQYLDDAEMVVVFQAPKAAPAPEEPEEEAPEEKTPEEKPEDSGEETVSESVKVQDLSKSVGLKTVQKKCPCACGKKKTVKEEEAPKKKDPPKKAPPKKDSGKKSEEKVLPEAELQATGTELKGKIEDAVKRVLYLPDEEEVEMVDLEGYGDDNDVFFFKLAFKE